jgi:cathepsin L
MRSLSACTAAVLLLAFASGLATARPPVAAELTGSYSYDQYLRDFGKARPATDAEYAERASHFALELGSVLKHNADASQLYVQGLNQFSDWSVDEKAQTLMAPGRDAFKRSNRDAGGRLSHGAIKAAKVGAKPTRRAVDYRRADPPVLTAVKDQGRCGSCWSFATTESIEAHTAIQTGKLFSLSMQQMVSCVPNVTMSILDVPPNNQTITQIMHACDGYIPTNAIDYVVQQQNGQMSQEWEIPYQSYWAQYVPKSSPAYKPTPPCMNGADRTLTTVNVTGYKMPTTNAEVEIENAIFSAGPLITIISVPQSFMAYEAGIYAGAECVEYDLMTPAHAVQIVGYGHDAAAQADYWIVRNSWAPIWGENGYIRMLRTEPTECGEMWLPTNGDVTHLTRQRSCGTCGLLGWTVYPTVA